MNRLNIEVILQGIQIKNMLDYNNIDKSDLKELLSYTVEILSLIEKSDDISNTSKLTIQEYKDKFQKVLK